VFEFLKACIKLLCCAVKDVTVFSRRESVRIISVLARYIGMTQHHYLATLHRLMMVCISVLYKS